VGLLRVDLLADVALRRRVLDEPQVGQLHVLGQVTELFAAMRTQRGGATTGLFASWLFFLYAGLRWFGLVSTSEIWKNV
jgi:hypothetical protein